MSEIVVDLGNAPVVVHVGEDATAASLAASAAAASAAAAAEDAAKIDNLAVEIELTQTNAGDADGTYAFKVAPEPGKQLVRGGTMVMTAPADRGFIDLLGTTLEIEGYNPGDPRQVRRAPGGINDQIEGGAWMEGSRLRFSELQPGGYFLLLEPAVGALTVGDGAAQTFAILRANQIAAIAAMGG